MVHHTGRANPAPQIRIAAVLRKHDAMLVAFWRHMQRALTRVPGCVFSKFDATDDLEQALDWGAQGLLVHVNREQLIEPLSGLGIPVVNTSGIYGDLPFPSVLPDNIAAGRLAGQHLLAKGYQHFAYVGPKWRYARDRLTGLRSALGLADDEALPVFTNLVRGNVPADPAGLNPEQRALLDWLDALPDDTGLCLADDRIGYTLTELLRRIDRDPLERFGIITCHDRDAPTNPPLSGVEMPEERWAYTAAQLVADMVRGRAPRDRSVTLQPLGVIERESTSRLPSDDPVLRDAVRFIADHAGNPIAVTDVAAAVHLGRRAVERRFVRELGRTVLEEIHRVHVEQAKALLIETDRAMHNVAIDSGLSDEKHLRRLFGKYVGMTPSAFRDQHRLR